MTVSEPPVYFLDTSALVKRYHPERGSEVVQRAFADPTARRLISDLSIIEVHSAFARRVRMGEITPEDFHAVKAAFTADIQSGSLTVEALDDTDTAEAARLVERYGLVQELRTLDAMHLAVMQAARDEPPACRLLRGSCSVRCVGRRRVYGSQSGGAPSCPPISIVHASFCTLLRQSYPAETEKALGDLLCNLSSGQMPEGLSRSPRRRRILTDVLPHFGG